MKTWLTENEPYLRGLEVLAVVIVGGYVSYLQLGISQQQAQVAEKSLKVSEAELKLIELQTDLQRMDHQPYFTFDHTGVCPNFLPSMFWIRNRSGAEVRSLDGTAKLFLVVKSREGDRRILLDHFYERSRPFPEDGILQFSNSACFIYPMFMGCEIENYNDGHLVGHAFFPERYPMPFTICNYVEVSHVTEDARKVVQRFVMKFPATFPTPVSEEPKYEVVFDVRKYRKSEHGYEFDTMFDDFRNVLTQQTGIALQRTHRKFEFLPAPPKISDAP